MAPYLCKRRACKMSRGPLRLSLLISFALAVVLVESIVISGELLADRFHHARIELADALIKLTRPDPHFKS